MSNYKKIAIDVGHARHTGAAGNGLQEHEVVATLAKQVKKILSGQWNIHAEIVDFPEMSNRGDLNAAIARTREQVQAVTVAVIPDPKTPQDSKN
jgi:hypothetical protein